MRASPLVAVVIVSFNTLTLLRACLTSVIAFTDPAATEILVVDNASSDGSPDMVRREFSMVTLIESTSNRGFGAANNMGVRAAHADYVLLLNSDAELSRGTAAGLLDFLKAQADTACVAPRVVLPDGRRQPRVFGNQPDLGRLCLQAVPIGKLFPRAAWLEGTDGSHGPGGVERDVGWVSGVCMAMRRSDYLAVGGFDESIFMYCEDVDLCARLSRRGRIVRIDRWAVVHHGGASAPGMVAQARSAVWAQRNLLGLVRRRSRAAAAAARPILLAGILLRIGAGLGTIPRRGFRDNLLLQTSWARLRDLVGVADRSS